MMQLKLKPSEKYIFSLLDINLIDFGNIDFDTNDDTISLPLITSNVPIITDNLDDDMCLFINDAILDGDMWFTYNAVDHNVEMFIAECHAVQSTTHIANIISLIEYQHPEYEQYKTAYDNFNALVKEHLKQQIRAIMTDVKGEFVKDTFKEDTYFQSRTDKQKDIYYTIYRWWEKLINGEVNFTDIDNGEGTVFVALNDWH